MKQLLYAGLLITTLCLTFSACKTRRQPIANEKAPALTLEETLQNVDTAAYMILAACMADCTFNELPLSFKIGATHRDFVAHAKSIADKGNGRFENGQLTYFTDHSRLPSDLTVNNTSILNIGTTIPDTLPVSSVEYTYTLQRPDSTEAIRIIDMLMSGARKGGFKASPLIAMPGCFSQVWTRNNLIIQAFFIYSNSTLHFCATDAKTLSQNEANGMVASIKAKAAQCHISIEDLKQRVQRYCKRHHKDYKGEGHWRADWYTSSIIVRHRYSFTDENLRRRLREAMFTFDYALNLGKVYQLTEAEIQG